MSIFEPKENLAMIPKRVVLDTNVCLDLFVFRDPRWEALLHALQSGELEAVTRADCRTEWQIVLGYAHLPLDDVSRAASMTEFDALITCLPEQEPLPDDVRLPLCRDPDDQKFLQLAHQARAATLITKDKALLKLAGKATRLGLFTILTPERWVQHHAAETSVAHVA
jgi:putative PIN family toxin of toxin-antitoxin system